MKWAEISPECLWMQLYFTKSVYWLYFKTALLIPLPYSLQWCSPKNKYILNQHHLKSDPNWKMDVNSFKRIYNQRCECRNASFHPASLHCPLTPSSKDLALCLAEVTRKSFPRLSSVKTAKVIWYGHDHLTFGPQRYPKLKFSSSSVAISFQ